MGLFTRADLLRKVIGDTTEIDHVQSVFNTYTVLQDAFNILQPFKLKSSDVLDATADEENNAITLHLSDAKLVKQIKNEICDLSEVSVTAKGKFLTLSF